MVLKPQESSVSFGVGVGGIVSAGHEGQSASGINLSVVWDAQAFLMIADAAFYAVDEELNVAQLGIGYFYAPSQKPSTVYLGVGLALTTLNDMPGHIDGGDTGHSVHGRGHGDGDENQKAGLSVYGAVGWLAGRSRKFSMRPELGYQVATFKLNGRRLHGPRFSVSVGF